LKSHVKRIVGIIRKLRPGMRILIWDDVIRGDQFISNEKLVNKYLFVFCLDAQKKLRFVLS